MTLEDQVQEAYERAAEWITIVERAYASDAPFDFDGAYYRLKGVVSKPASIQQPRPVTMNAAFGGPGRDFASRHCDFLFSTFTDIADGRKHLADIRTRASAAGRDVGAYTACHAATSKPPTPASAIVGVSGAAATRFGVVTASNLSLPALTSGMPAVNWSNRNATCPLATSCRACGCPL